MYIFILVAVIPLKVFSFRIYTTIRAFLKLLETQLKLKFCYRMYGGWRSFLNSRTAWKRRPYSCDFFLWSKKESHGVISSEGWVIIAMVLAAGCNRRFCSSASNRGTNLAEISRTYTYSRKNSMACSMRGAAPAHSLQKYFFVLQWWYCELSPRFRLCGLWRYDL